MSTCQWTPVGVIFPQDYSFLKWLHDMEAVNTMVKGHMFMLGDGIIYGNAKYGEKYAQALDHTSYSEKTLRNAVWVCNKIPITERHEKLDFSHHLIVASLDVERREELLRRAELDGWSVARLRKEKKELYGANKPNRDYDKIALKKVLTFEQWWQEYLKEMEFSEEEMKLMDSFCDVANDAWIASRMNY